MSGVKGQKGGGGSRKDAGRPPSTLHLDKETARTLALIVRHRRGVNPALRAEDLVKLWAMNEWQELDAMFQEGEKCDG